MDARRIRTLIVDDEPLARKRLRTLLKDKPDFDVVGECGDGHEAIAVIAEKRPDLVFLDIQMPEVGGFEVVEAIPKSAMPAVVFTTAYDKYAVQAFEIHALDYLLKPFDEQRFETALDRVKSELFRDDAGAIGERLLALMKHLEADRKYIERLLVKTDGRVFFLKTPEIDWIESAGNYVRLHIGRQEHLLRETMNELESKLDPARFLRIHRSTLVNIDRIKEMQPWFSGDYAVILHDGTKLRLSRGQRQKLQGLLGKHA